MKKFLVVVGMVFAFVGSAFAAINLNTASQGDLTAVSGIGEKKAKAIVDYRTKNGPFKSVDDLDNVPGFGKKTVDKLRPQLSVSGGDTVKANKAAKKGKNKDAAAADAMPAQAATPATPATPAIPATPAAGKGKATPATPSTPATPAEPAKAKY